jgi:hypothetical protein
MAQGRVPFNAVAAGGVPPGFDTPEAAFNAALLREQYRSLARLGPYVHGIVIVAALAFFGATPTGSLLTGILLPTALIAVSVFRLSSWFKARAGVELEALDRVRRKVRAASVLGPTLTRSRWRQRSRPGREAWSNSRWRSSPSGLSPPFAQCASTGSRARPT